MKTLQTILSLSCAIHCMGTPFLVLLMPALAPFIQNALIEFSILIVSLILGTVIIYTGYCTHKKRHCLLLYITGSACWLIHYIGEVLNYTKIDTLIFIGGTIFILISYILNHNASKECCSSHNH